MTIVTYLYLVKLMPTLCCLYRYLALGFASTILSHGSRSSKSTVDLNSNQSLALDDLLQRVTSRLEEGSKYTLFTSDGSGFGNLARGMVATLALSLITNRRFLIDSKSTYFQLFDQPLSKVSISKSSVKFHGLKAYGRKLLRMGQPTQSFAKNILGSLTSAADYIEHDAGCTFADFFYTDEYRDRWRTVFGRDLRWDEIDVLLVMWLFQSPKEELLSNTQRVLDSIHWSTFSQHLVVQYRGFVDVAYKNGKTFDKDIHLIKDQVMLFKSHHQSQLSDVLIYVTSDSFDWSKAIQAHLRKSFPHVVVSSLFPNTHSARADSSDLVKVQGMVDWVILGLARDTICTGSTYCISARARVGMGSPQWFGSESNQSLSSYPQAGPDAPFDRYVLTAPGLANSSRFLSLGGSTVRYQQIDPTASRQDRPPYNGRMTAPNEPLPWFYMHT